MEKIEFKNYEDSPTTPINAQSLNAMQDNIEEAIENIDITDQLELKADKSDTYTKTEVNNELSNKVNVKTLNINSYNLNNIDYNVAFAYGNDCTNKPIGASDGWLTNVLHATNNNYRSQTWTDRPNGRAWKRVMENGEWGEWQDMNPGSTYVQVQLSGNLTLNADNKRFDNLYSGPYNGSGLTVSTTGVTIGAGISTIEISAMYYYRHLASSGERNLYMEIRKGSTVINRISKSFSATSVSEGMAFAPFYVDVEQGDKIEMWATNTGGGSSYMAGYHSTTGPRTHLLIKKVR